jgi:hypothetical protein
MTNDRRTLLKGVALAAAVGGAATAQAQPGPAKGGKARKYKRIATEEGYNHPDLLAAQQKYLETHDDEPAPAPRGSPT